MDETNPVFSELTARNLGRSRLPIPDSASQTRASQAIAEEYKPSYDAAKTDEEKSELAKKLIQDGRRTGDNAQRFVMLRIAKDIALKANDWETAFEAVDHIARYYDFDALDAKAGMIMSLGDQLQQADDSSALYDAVDAALDDAIAQDRYELARQFGRRAGSVATKMGNAALANESAEKLAQVERFAAEYAALGPVPKTLERNPTDPQANLAMGKFLCFTKENWEQGLPMLALCSDPTLKALAVAEVQRPVDAARQSSLGDRWWELAQRHDGPPQMAMRARAAYWYQMALPRLTSPILKQRAEERMAEAQADIKSEPAPMIVAQVFTTALALERTAQQMSSAKEGYALYREFITDGSVADEEKAAAKQRLGFWEEAAARDLVRLGTDWVSRAELQKARTESLRLIDEALDLLSHLEGPPARSNLEKASRADPNGTRADFLLGILYAIDGRNFKKAQSHFATCLRREPQNVFAMNNWALAALMHGDHHGAQKQIRTALEIGKSLPPLVHNVGRILEANRDSKLPLMPAHKTTYMELIRKQRKPDEDRGWVYLIPRGEGDNKLVRTLNSDETRRMTCELLDTAIWVEDRTCTACKGMKTQPCTNRGCARGTILKTVTLPLSIDKKTGRVMGGTQKLREPCPNCDGKGHVDCPHCKNGLDESLR